MNIVQTPAPTATDGGTSSSKGTIGCLSVTSIGNGGRRDLRGSRSCRYSGLRRNPDRLRPGRDVLCQMVNLSNVLLAKNTGGKKWISWSGFVVCLIVLGALLWQTALSSPGNLLVLVVMVVAAVLIEVVYRVITGREIKVAGVGRGRK